MAYIVSGKTGATDGTTTASFTPSEWWSASEQQSGDYIVICVTNDGGGTALGGMGSWTEVGSPAPSNSGCRTGIFYQKHTGTTISAPTITGANDDWAMAAVLIRDADGTTFLDVAAGITEQTASTQTPTAPAVTTSNANCLVLRCLGRDGSGTSFQSGMIGQGVNGARSTDARSTGTVNVEAMIEWQIQGSAGSTGTYGWVSNANDGGRQVTLAIRNASGGAVPAYPVSSPVTVPHAWHLAPTVTLLSTWHGTINGVTVRDGTTSGGAVSSSVVPQSATYFPLGLYGYHRTIGQTQTATTGLAGIYGCAATLDSAADFSASLFMSQFLWPGISTAVDDAGPMLYFRDGSGGWCVIRPFTENVANAQSLRTFVSYLPDETEIDGSGTIDWTDITHIGCAINCIATSGSSLTRTVGFRPILAIPLSGGAMSIVGGSSSRPFSLRDVANILNSGPSFGLPAIQGAKQQLSGIGVQIGNGTTETHFDGDATSWEFADLSYIGARYRSNDLEFRVKSSASDGFALGAASIGSGIQQDFVVDSSSSTSASYDFGGTIFGMAVTLIDGITINGCTFAGCGEIDAQTAVIEDCNITGTTSTDAAIAFDGNSSMTNTAIDVSGTSAAYHLELGTSVTAFTLTDVVFSGTPGTDKVHVKRTTGTVTITLDGSTTLAGGDVTSDGATVVINAPSNDLVITSSETGTLIQVFTTGTQTVLASTTGTSLTYTHSDETVDVVVQKAGFLPRREAGVVLSGDVSRSYDLVIDPVYDAAHGLTYTTDASWSRAANQLTVPTWGPTVRAVYSLMIDAFISQTGLRNTPFNIQMNGPNSMILINGAEGASDTTPANMTGGGVRYLSVSDVVTAEWCAVRSIGTATGFTGEYQQTAGSGTTDARATGAFNQTIKTYGDASHGNFDKRAHLVLKFQPNGYRPVRVDVLSTYGVSAVEPVLYIVAMEPLAIDGLTLGSPGALSLTMTDHGASPVTWDAGDGNKDYSITITDSGATSGASILRWLNYNLSLDATFEGKDPFNWPELVIDNGSEYETVRGQTEGGTGATLKGVRVLRGTDPHPDFSRFQADDGTYGTPPVVASAAITGIVSGSRVQIYNVTTATEIYNDVPGTSYADSYVNGTDYTDGDQVRVRITYCVGTSAKLEFTQTVVAAETGWSVVAAQEDDEVYNALAIDGSAVTGFAADYAADEVNVTIASNFNVSDLYAWWVYNLTTSQGISDFFGGLRAIDLGNFRIEQGTVDIYIDNTTATNLRQLDNRRIFREDEAYPVKSSGGGGIDVVWRNTILIAETGISGLTTQESQDLASIKAMTALIPAVIP